MVDLPSNPFPGARTPLCCRQCGFRSGQAASFRIERGGVLGRRVPVCFGCKPYTVGGVDRLYWRGWFSHLITAAVIAGWTCLEGGWTFGLAVWLTMIAARPIVILIHEAGHVLAAKAVGFDVLAARIGRGPEVLARQAWGVRWSIHRYAVLGGITRFILPENAGRWRRGVTYAAGALANLAASSLAIPLLVLAGNALGGLASAILLGWMIQHWLMAFNALWPTGGRGDHPSDGAMILRLLRKPLRTTDELVLLLERTQRLVLTGRFSQASEVFEAQLKIWPNDPYALGMVVHCTAQAHGDRAALARYRTLQAQAPAGPPRAFEWHRPITGWMAGNIAWSAINAGPDADLDLAERHLEMALTLQPDAPDIRATHGAWLMARGRADAGEDLLVQALPDVEEPVDRAGFARRLAQARRARGDLAGADEAERWSAHTLARALRRPPV